MFVYYNDHITYHLYLHDKEKIIQIKNLRIFINVKEKTDFHTIFYNAIAVSKSNIKNSIAQLL